MSEPPPTFRLLPKRADPLRSVWAAEGSGGGAAALAAAITTDGFRLPAPRAPAARAQAASRPPPSATALSLGRGDLTPGSAGRALAHPFGAITFADAAAFNRSEVAERIRRSFDAMVARSPIGGHLHARMRYSPLPVAGMGAAFGSATAHVGTAFGSPAALGMVSHPFPPQHHQPPAFEAGGHHHSPGGAPQVVQTNEYSQVLRHHSPSFQAVSTVHTVHHRSMLVQPAGPVVKQEASDAWQHGMLLAPRQKVQRQQPVGTHAEQLQQQQQQQQQAWPKQEDEEKQPLWPMSARLRAAATLAAAVAAAEAAEEAEASAKAAMAAKAATAPPARLNSGSDEGTAVAPGGIGPALPAALGDVVVKLEAQETQGPPLAQRPASGCSGEAAVKGLADKQKWQQQPTLPQQQDEQLAWQQQQQQRPAMRASSRRVQPQGSEQPLQETLRATVPTGNTQGHAVPSSKAASRKRSAAQAAAGSAPPQEEPQEEPQLAPQAKRPRGRPPQPCSAATAAGRPVPATPTAQVARKAEQQQAAQVKRARGRPPKLASAAADAAQPALTPPSTQHLQPPAPAAAPVQAGVVQGGGELEVTRSGRKRMPPLAFWANETKVRDRDGWVQGVARLTCIPDQTGGGESAAALKAPPSAKKLAAAPAPSPAKKPAATPAASHARKQSAVPHHKAAKKSSAATATKGGGMQAAVAVNGKAAGERAAEAPARKQKQQQPQVKGASLAAVAAAAGAQAAAARSVPASVAAAKAKPRSMAASKPTAGKEAVRTRGQAAAAVKVEAAAPAAMPPAPVVPGFSPATIERVRAMPRSNRVVRRCGECKACTNPKLKKKCYVAAALDDADPNPQPTQQAVEGVRPLAAKEAREDGMGEGRGASSSGGSSSSSSMDGTEGKQGRRRQQQQPANRRQAAQDGSGSAGQGRKGKRALPAAAAEAQPLPKRRQQLAGRAPKEQQQDGGQAKQQQHLQAQPQQQQTQKRGGLAKFCGRRLPAAPVAYGAAAPVLPLPPIVAAAVGDEGEEWDWDAC